MGCGLEVHHPAGVQSLAAARPGIESRLAAQNQERLSKALQDRLWAAEGVVVRDDLLEAAIPRGGRPAGPDQ